MRDYRIKWWPLTSRARFTAQGWRSLCWLWGLAAEKLLHNFCSTKLSWKLHLTTKYFLRALEEWMFDDRNLSMWDLSGCWGRWGWMTQVLWSKVRRVKWKSAPNAAVVSPAIPASSQTPWNPYPGVSCGELGKGTWQDIICTYLNSGFPLWFGFAFHEGPV